MQASWYAMECDFKPFSPPRTACLPFLPKPPGLETPSLDTWRTHLDISPQPWSLTAFGLSRFPKIWPSLLPRCHRRLVSEANMLVASSIGPLLSRCLWQLRVSHETHGSTHASAPDFATSISISIRDALHFSVLLLHRPLQLEVCLPLLFDALLLNVPNHSRVHRLGVNRISATVVEVLELRNPLTAFSDRCA